MGVCVSEEEADDDEGVGCANGEERKKTSEIRNYYNNV